MDSNALESLFDRVQKPARYTGGELNSVIKDKERMAIRFAFAFPDLYEVGMSHLGMKILYGLFNAQPDVWCERVFMPDRDMEALLREEEIPLFALESRDALGDFDFIGFTLQYEMCYTTVLHMLDLAGIPLRAADPGRAVSAGGGGRSLRLQSGAGGGLLRSIHPGRRGRGQPGAVRALSPLPGGRILQGGVSPAGGPNRRGVRTLLIRRCLREGRQGGVGDAAGGARPPGCASGCCWIWTGRIIRTSLWCPLSISSTTAP